MTMTMITIMMTTIAKPQNISLRVPFCRRFASTRAVVPADTYSTDFATCRPSIKLCDQVHVACQLGVCYLLYSTTACQDRTPTHACPMHLTLHDSHWCSLCQVQMSVVTARQTHCNPKRIP